MKQTNLPGVGMVNVSIVIAKVIKVMTIPVQIAVTTITLIGSGCIRNLALLI
jgi:hypothetical protein